MAKKQQLNYWQKRVLANEEKAQRHAATAVQRQSRLYHSAYIEIAKQIEQLALELLESEKYGKITRTELWQYKKYIDLQEYISRMFGDLSSSQISIANSVLYKIFEETIGTTLDELNVESNVAYTILNKQQADQVLNTAWSGKHYSQRIYGTNGKIAERIKKDITDLVIQGKNTETIKKAIMRDFNVSYSYADRLIRTEASHCFNEAAKSAYRQAKVEKVRIIKEPDCCPKCQAMKTEYLLGNEPLLPLHPNCRCCYAPVVNLD